MLVILYIGKHDKWPHKDKKNTIFGVLLRAARSFIKMIVSKLAVFALGAAHNIDPLHFNYPPSGKQHGPMPVQKN